MQTQNNAYETDTLDPGIRSRFVNNNNDLKVHVLEAGFETKDRPLVILLHGHPELAYSWRKQLIPLAEQGYHVIAPDLRGSGRTTGWEEGFDCDLENFTLYNNARDIIGLAYALGYKSVAAVVGHDFGSPLAALCTLIRPDIFTSLIIMSTPWPGSPQFPFNTANLTDDEKQYDPTLTKSMEDQLASLSPPRKHYQMYFSSKEANDEIMNAPQGIHDFMRAYNHAKSGDWLENSPHPLQAKSLEEFAKIPTYYVMDFNKTMPEQVMDYMPSKEEIAACEWLPDNELQVFSNEFERTQFQGTMNSYRCATNPKFFDAIKAYTGKNIEVPVTFIAGAKDWGPYQSYGNFEAMKATLPILDIHFVEGAGHWVQQEKPEQVNKIMIDFLAKTKKRN
jgi:pimeloyl-ACP methyl ester carboxylesterase